MISIHQSESIVIINGVQICGAPSLGQEFICSFSHNHTGKHSWDQNDPEDAVCNNHGILHCNMCKDN